MLYKLDRKCAMERALILEQVVQKRLTRRNAQEKLELSERQVRRLIRAYQACGVNGLLAKPRAGNRRIPDQVKEKALELIRAHYFDFGPTFAAEKLVEAHNIRVSKETVRKWMDSDRVRKVRQRKLKPLHQRRLRRERFGELVQIDGSHHHWFGQEHARTCLYVFVDDATSAIVGLFMAPTETTLGYLKTMVLHAEAYGTPLAYYSDRHSIFIKSNDRAASEPSQVHRVLKKLDIELICANSPQAKGRVERTHKVLQDRLVKEFRLRNIVDIEGANAYLEEFRVRYNTQFAKEPHSTIDAHRAFCVPDEEKSLLFSVVKERTVSKQLEIVHLNTIYQLSAKHRSHSLRNTRVALCYTYDNRTIILHKGQSLVFTKLPLQQKPSVVSRAELDSHFVNKLLKRRSAPPAFSDHDTAVL